VELSIICVNWNSDDYLRACIESIQRYTHGIDFEIIVVDNASTEGSIERLQESFPDVVFVKSETNLGFSRANNLGYLHSTGDCLLFLNPDTKLIGAAIEPMLECLRAKPDAGIVGGRLLNADGSVQTTAIQTFPTILNQLLDVEYLRLRWPANNLWNISPLFRHTEEPVRVQMISGACMLLKRTVFEKAGRFSEDYFMYAEDIDLNFKVCSQGLSNYYVAGAQVIHFGGRSSSHQRVSQWATMMKFRAMMVYFRKHKGGIYAALYRGVMGLVAAGRLCLLGLALPLTCVMGRRERVLWAAEKWACVLSCAVGVGRCARESR
jgi:GT2 family glycosyltransferase